MPPLLRLVGVVVPAGSSKPPGRLLQTPLLSASSSASPSLGCRCRRSSSFSNAEPGDETARRWWYDDDDDDDDGGGGGGVFGGTEELFDEPWFSKVFRTYGYVLPVMLASMLVATGPKAFLMAMAIPLGQSAISFLLAAIWGTRGRGGNQRTTFEESEYNSSDFEGQENWGGNKTYSYYNKTRQSSYQQSSDSDDAGHGTTNSNRADQGAGTSTKSGFGGWDELDGDDYSSKRSPPPPGTPADDAAVRRGVVSRRRMSTRRMGNRYKQAPLMMRLLVAVFPFLGSWFRIL